MPFTNNWNVIGGEVPTSSKWNQLGENDDYLKALIDEVRNEIFPVGTIASYWSDGGAIPNNFAVCDGGVVSDANSPLNGLTLPDLRNKFIRGVGNQDLRSTPVTGGADTVGLTTANLPAHTHSSGSLSTNSTGSHQHSVKKVNQGVTSYTSGTSRHSNHNFNDGATLTEYAGNHSHTISGNTGSVGSGTAHNNIPAYTGMVQIMRIK